MCIALIATISLISCVESQPPPLYPLAIGVAEITPIKPIIQPVITLPSATENQIIASPSQQSNDQFAASVAMALDTLVVGAPNTTGGGAVWVFDLATTNTSPLKLVPPHLSTGDAFGSAVDISNSGRFILVGAPNTTVGNLPKVGAVHLWEKVESKWVYSGTFSSDLVSSNALLGRAVAIDDDTFLAGAPFATLSKVAAHGIVITWMRDAEGIWSESSTLNPNNLVANAQFGASISLKATQALIGSPYARASDRNELGMANIFLRQKSHWPPTPLVQISDTNNVLHKGDRGGGHMGGTGDHFGWSVCMFGNVALVGAPGDSHGNYSGNGSVDLFEREEQTWSQTQYIIAEDLESNAAFGSAVGIAGTHLVIGAPMKVHADKSAAGVVYMYQIIPGSNPKQEEFLITLVPAQSNVHARFGAALACTTNRIAVCAPGAQDLSTPGFIYIFNQSENSWGVASAVVDPVVAFMQPAAKQ